MTPCTEVESLSRHSSSWFLRFCARQTHLREIGGRPEVAKERLDDGDARKGLVFGKDLARVAGKSISQPERFDFESVAHSPGRPSFEAAVGARGLRVKIHPGEAGRRLLARKRGNGRESLLFAECILKIDLRLRERELIIDEVFLTNHIRRTDVTDVFQTAQ